MQINYKYVFFLLLIQLTSCNQEKYSEEVIKDIITKSYYVFVDEIDKSPCPPFFSNPKECRACNGYINFYDVIILHNKVEKIKWNESNSKDSILNFAIHKNLVNTYFDVNLDSVSWQRPESLDEGFLNLIEIELFQDSVTVYGICRGKEMVVSVDLPNIHTNQKLTKFEIL